MTTGDLVFVILELILAVSLFILAGYADKVLSPKWKLCYMLPMVVGLVYGGLFGTDACLSGIYIGSALALLGFIREKKKFRQMISLVFGALVLCGVPVCLYSPGYRAPDYAAEFRKGFETMEKYYVLAEHKGISWTSLYEEYMPRFEEVQKNHDAVGNLILWNAFCREFRDGHVNYSVTDEKVLKEARERVYGNDYGLALMTLADGRTVAVNVEPDSLLTRAGIHNGTVITAWDGQEIEALKSRMDTTVYYPFPDKENEAFYSALPIAGKGGDQVEITWLDERGEQRTLEVPRMGYYALRLEETLDILDQGIKSSNLDWLKLDGNTCCLRLKGMMYDSETYSNGDHSKMQEEIREKLNMLKEEGVHKLIIDLRSNGGGSPQFIMAIAELFAPEGEHTYCYDGVWDEKNKCFLKDETSGKYVPGNGLRFEGKNLWQDGEILILVNAMTISAGDHFVQIMSAFDNVTIMGFTRSNSSGQAVRGVNFEQGSLSFSAVPALREDGSIFVDTDTSGISQVPLDVKIPFDERAVEALFEKGEDYLLTRAMEY